MKNALIWGAAGGIGQSILKTLKDQGWRTFGVARDSMEIQGLVDFGFDAQFDDLGSVEQTVYQISQEVDSLDFWCYAAGDILSSKVKQMTPME